MALYENFLYSNFPESIDGYEYMQDLTSNTYELAQQYQMLINQKKFSEASQYLIDHPELDRSVFNAIKYNKIIDSIKSIETFYSDDVRKYILELMSFKGEYSNLQKYIRYNVVSYNDSMIYLCTSDCPLGTLPTDTAYWYPLSIKGEKGVGIGLSYDGIWQANFTYQKDSCVTYNNVLYASNIDDNIAKTPAVNSAYWSLVFDISQFKTYDNSSSGLNSIDLEHAIDEVNLKVNTNTNEINTNRNNISTNTNSIANINSRISNINNTADANKSVKYAASAGVSDSCTGNSDSVDGFHFKVSSTDIKEGSTLQTNMFYFVYE